jgi:hypothetical protein
MELFSNKEDYKDNKEVYDILTRLEKAHKEQDELACAFLLTKLKQKNIKIIVANEPQ